MVEQRPVHESSLLVAMARCSPAYPVLIDA